MCTVTFIPTASGVLLTSNRDEHKDRPVAIFPQTYLSGGQSVIYPKDVQAGGTWIALRNGHSAAVLLNGGFEKHIRQSHYQQSRGMVMLEIIGSQEPVEKFYSIELYGIEPFTLILFVEEELRRCTWDGQEKHVKHLDPNKSHIWSSATLYDRHVHGQREKNLQEWLTKIQLPTSEEVLSYHMSDDLRYETCGSGDAQNVRTVSVTSLEIPVAGESRIRYHDLSSGKTFDTSVRPYAKPAKHRFDSLYWKARRFLIRLRHWEYWPFECVYLPLVPLWLWLSIRARSFLFFSAANPGIENSGFIHERKSDIYPLLPVGFYPKTVLCHAGMRADAIKSLLCESALTFPLIAKPDIGERGLQVKLLRTSDDLEDYRLASKFNFLVQEYIDYPHEIGVFYFRFPGEDHGHISGIVGKEFLSVKGDGKSSLLSLLTQSDRAILQLPALSEIYGNQFDQILAGGETLNLVPYGNHSRGCKFIDLQNHITPELTSVIDHACTQVRGFYFGRLDIRFKSWEDLTAGRHFSIIELNGTGSEPTHIYDPRHSLFRAWKEIYRHWEIVYRISMMNMRSGEQRLMTFKEGIAMYKSHKSYMDAI
ncbi:NRDE family protein [Dyadobacter psychrophilus]|uniref:Transport and Golgi organisation 2 n=1 Tax=Dyadobacter psychrophilus TaxID=651661 RepID=A0A1T5BTH5_9BACT|nr:NRDE family protein [Dyadobacter psychrophilus]SKB50441.1 Transport and Golgi organisation 2 [Dyadobacter psychrophilus]